MPASEFTWNTSAPIFQVYGTKRKAADDAQQSSQNREQMSQDDASAKRVCSWNPEELSSFRSNVPSTPLAEINHNHLTSAPNAVFNQGQPMHQEMTLEAQHRNMFANCVPWSGEDINAAVQSSNPQENFSMDLNEGTYSTSQVPQEMAQAHMTMDSDCCPDPAQYQLTPNHQPTLPSQDIRSDFCTNFCGSGDSSPTSGRVRCYCKPSWEGMMDMKPYISDYY